MDIYGHFLYIIIYDYIFLYKKFFTEYIYTNTHTHTYMYIYMLYVVDETL